MNDLESPARRLRGDPAEVRAQVGLALVQAGELVDRMTERLEYLAEVDVADAVALHRVAATLLVLAAP